MYSDPKRHGRDKLAGLGLILNSRAYRDSLPATELGRLRDPSRGNVEYFAKRYATGIYCYYRRKWRLEPEKAKDLTMGFISEKLISGSLLKNYQPGKSRFRSYLLQALRNYRVDSYRKDRKLNIVPLDPAMETCPEAEPCVEDPAGREAMKNCTHDQLRAALIRVGDDCDRTGLREHFQIFALRHFSDPQPGWEEIGRKFAMGWQQAKNKAWTVKERLRKAILEEFQISGMTAEQVKEEIRSRCEDFHGSAGRDFEDPES